MFNKREFVTGTIAAALSSAVAQAQPAPARQRSQSAAHNSAWHDENHPDVQVPPGYGNESATGSAIPNCAAKPDAADEPPLAGMKVPVAVYDRPDRIAINPIARESPNPDNATARQLVLRTPRSSPTVTAWSSISGRWEVVVEIAVAGIVKEGKLNGTLK